MSNPRFTFCIPNLNKMQYLPACIESMLAQDCEDWKCVFVDGYSTDGSWEYMQQFASDPRFLLLQGVQQGMYTDWNECLRHVDTEYFYILTSDDTCYPELVSTTTRALDTYSDLDACHFPIHILNQDGQVIESFDQVTEKYCPIYSEANQSMHRRSGICEFMMHFTYRAIYVSITSLVFRQNLMAKLQGFSSNYGSIGDYDWTMRLGLYTDVLFVPISLATWRNYPEQATRLSNSNQIYQYRLEIASKNLELLMGSVQTEALPKQINQQQLLNSFSDQYAASLYGRLLLPQSYSEFLNSLYSCLRHFPAYPLKKMLKHLTRNKLYPYQLPDSLSQELIENYGLHWPPHRVAPVFQNHLIST